MYQLIRGLSDAAAAQVEGGELGLTRVLKLAEAFEMGKTSQELVNSAGQISRISDHQLNKRNSRNDRATSNKDAKTKPSNQSRTSTQQSKSCNNCGSNQHSSKLAERREKCPAFTENCSKCGTMGHTGAKCRGGPRNKSQDTKTQAQVKAVESTPAPEANLGTLSASWFLINADQHSQAQPQVGELNEVLGEFPPVLRESHTQRDDPTPVIAGLAQQ